MTLIAALQPTSDLVLLVLAQCESIHIYFPCERKYDGEPVNLSGAACEAALEGIPSTAFSATSNSQVSFTTLTSNPTSTATLAALLYAQLTTSFTQTLLSSTSRPILPANITLNVNFPSTSGCSSTSQFKFVLTRLVSDSSATDVETCGSTHLPMETTVVHSSGCFASVSVIDARTKKDVDASTQAFVLNRLGSFLSCFTN